MATHSGTLAWRIPWREKPGRLQSMGWQSWTRLSDFTYTGIKRQVFPSLLSLSSPISANRFLIFLSSQNPSYLPSPNGNPLQYSCGEGPMDGRTWWAAVHVITRSRTRLSDFTFTFHFHALEKEMATHSSILAWRIPGMGELGGLPSLGSHRVGHD